MEREDPRRTQIRTLQMRMWRGTRRFLFPSLYQATEDESTEDKSAENNSIPSITARIRAVVGPEVDILFPYQPFFDGDENAP